MKHILCVIGIWVLKAVLCVLYMALKLTYFVAYFLTFLVGRIGVMVSGVCLLLAVLFFIFLGAIDGLKILGLFLAVVALPYIARAIIDPINNFTDRVFHWLMA